MLNFWNTVFPIPNGLIKGTRMVDFLDFFW